MGIKAGIVGLTNIGKTTIFNAITASEVPSSNYQFATIDPNTAIVNVPDDRVDEIFANTTSRRKIYNTLEVLDIAGLIKGASKGEGLGNKFLGDIKTVDAILHVVRCFDDENVPHVDNSVNPLRDIDTIEAELMIKDLETVENRIKKNEKLVRSQDKAAKKLQPLYEKLQESLSELVHPRQLELSEEEVASLWDLNLITLKPVIFVCNISEDEIVSGEEGEYLQKVREYAGSHGCGAVAICGKLEEEIALLPDEEKEEYMADYGMKEPGLNTLIKNAYDILGLSTYITEGEIEVRAWNIKKGMKAPQAAGVIHTDFEKKFIKAEVISFVDFRECGFDRNKAKQVGKARLEGKEYLVKDGDIIVFKVGK